MEPHWLWFTLHGRAGRALFDVINMKDKSRDETRNVSVGEVLLMHVVEVTPHLANLSSLNEAYKQQSHRRNISCLMSYGATQNARVDSMRELLLVNVRNTSTPAAPNAVVSDV